MWEMFFEGDINLVAEIFGMGKTSAGKMILWNDSPQKRNFRGKKAYFDGREGIIEMGNYSIREILCREKTFQEKIIVRGEISWRTNNCRRKVFFKQIFLRGKILRGKLLYKNYYGKGNLLKGIII